MYDQVSMGNNQLCHALFSLYRGEIFCKYSIEAVDGVTHEMITLYQVVIECHFRKVCKGSHQDQVR